MTVLEQLRLRARLVRIVTGDAGEHAITICCREYVKVFRDSNARHGGHRCTVNNVVISIVYQSRR